MLPVLDAANAEGGVSASEHGELTQSSDGAPFGHSEPVVLESLELVAAVEEAALVVLGLVELLGDGCGGLADGGRIGASAFCETGDRTTVTGTVAVGAGRTAGRGGVGEAGLDKGAMG